MGKVVVQYVEHGTGRPMLALHGAGVDHREAEACFEPVLDGAAGRRIDPDLPGMGRTIAPEPRRSADDVLDTLLNFTDELIGGTAHLLIGRSAGACYAQAMAARRPAPVAGGPTGRDGAARDCGIRPRHRWRRRALAWGGGLVMAREPHPSI